MRTDDAVRQRAITIIFAHKLLILLPLVIVFPISCALGFWPRAKQWQSIGTVWVDQATLSQSSVNLGWTPAGNQVSFLNSLMHTASFSGSVLQQTSLAPMLNDPASADRARLIFWNSVTATRVGNNFLVITASTTDPTLSLQFAQGVLDNYQKIVSSRGESISGTQLSNASDQLKQAQQSLVDARTQLANYLDLHPDLAGHDQGASLAAATDVNLALLQQQVTDAQSTYTAARQHYLDVQDAATSGQQSASYSFTVIDKPQLATAPVHLSLLERLRIPVIGLVAGLLLGAGVAAVLVLTDRSVLSAYDVQSGLDLTLLGEIPELTPEDATAEGGGVRERLVAMVR